MAESNDLPENFQWIKMPVRNADFHIALSVGNKADLPAEVRNALEKLMDSLQKEELASLEKTDTGVKLLGAAFYDATRQ